MTTQPNPLTAEVPLTALTGDQLRARVARAQLYLIDMTPVAGAAGPDLQRDHLRYLFKLEVEGRLYGCGPLGEPAAPGTDMAIVAAASAAEAARIAESEPLHTAGLRRNTVRGHTMNEGVACYVGRALYQRVQSAAPFDPNTSNVTLSLEALEARANDVPLFLVHLVPTTKPRAAEDTQTGYDHFIWLRSNEMQARLMSCGPVEAVSPLAPGIWGGGMGVVAVDGAEAERIAAAEPSGVMGYRRLWVQAWNLRYGLAAPMGQALVALNRLPA